MARFNSYEKKDKPSAGDTVLVYDNEDSQDVLKQVEVQALFEEYEVKSGKSVKELIEALLDGAGTARYS